MPVVPEKSASIPAEREQLVKQLAQELARQGVVGEPLIFENRVHPSGKLFFAVVVWSAWRDVPARQRSAIILDAYRRFDQSRGPDAAKAPHLSMATGLTWEEADRQGFFPFSITPNARAEEVNPDDVRAAMLKEGAVLTAAGLKLLFPDRESAESAYARLQQQLPQARWSLNQTIVAAQDD
jgi:hypothetical protein